MAASEEHRVMAVDAAGGKVRWSYTAGGRIDSPPTVSGGLAVFGCRDGWVYCLNAGNGKLVWRFRAAPVEEYILVDEQLESAWPVHGSVLILNGVVYCAAGWHSGLDGGVTLWALRAGSGQAVWKKRLEKLPGDYRRANGPVALLSSDGKFISMGQWSFDLKTGEKASPRQRPVMSFGASGFLDNKWFEFSNTKGQLDWRDRRGIRGQLLASGRERTCGVSVRFHRGFRNGMPLAGMGDFKLFGKKNSRDKGWTVTVPVRMQALVLAGGTVFVAGRLEPDLSEALKVKAPKQRAKLIAAMPDEKLIPRGSELWAISAANGKKLGALELDSLPVEDGLAAAGGKLYLSTRDGKLRCFGKR